VRLIIRYDVVPDDLVLNNTIQIVYNSGNAVASPVEYDAVAVLDDTEFVPLVKEEMIGHDIEFELNAYFDVSMTSSSAHISSRLTK
jgi:iron transport multicopper oxidase